MMGKTTEILRSSLETLWRVPTRVFGSRNERLLKTYTGSVAKINALEPGMAALSDSALAGKTGELKTLVATLPAYLNALTGKGVHIVTVNDYLARRDAEWMGKIYSFLGLSVG